MARRRLKLPSASDIWLSIKKRKSVWPVALVLALVLLILIALWWLSPYYDDIYALFPGFYQSSEYDSLSIKKNDIIAQNTELLAEIELLEVELEDVEATMDGYKVMIDLNSEIIILQESVWENMNEILLIDEELLAMRLPDTVAQYVRLSYEQDLARKDLATLSIEISNARRDLAEFKEMRSEFDNCLADVDWAGADKVISDSVLACVSTLPKVLEKTSQMEDRYEVDLERLTEYFTLLKEEWEANAAYYLAISQGDYEKANEHDQVFVEKKREISELNVVEISNEFYEEGLGPMIEQFVELSEEEEGLRAKAEQWYTSNIDR